MGKDPLRSARAAIDRGGLSMLGLLTVSAATERAIGRDAWGAFGHALVIPAAHRLKRERMARKDIDGLVDLALTFDHLGIGFTPIQKRSEIGAFCRLLSKDPPGTVVEIGTALGGSLFLLTRMARPTGLIVSLDLPWDDGRGGYPPWKRKLFRTFADEGQRLLLLEGDSHAERTVARLEAVLDGRGVDLLFIDGDHSYEGVTGDFRMYSHLVSSNGIIAFHDIVPGAERAVGGVPRAWQEIKEGRESLEFVESWEQGGFGIGVIRA